MIIWIPLDFIQTKSPRAVFVELLALTVFYIAWKGMSIRACFVFMIFIKARVAINVSLILDPEIASEMFGIEVPEEDRK